MKNLCLGNSVSCTNFAEATLGFKKGPMYSARQTRRGDGARKGPSCRAARRRSFVGAKETSPYGRGSLNPSNKPRHLVILLLITAKLPELRPRAPAAPDSSHIPLSARAQPDHTQFFPFPHRTQSILRRSIWLRIGKERVT